MTLRVLTLSTLFPDASRPRFAPFVERQTIELAAHPDVELSVVAPLGVPPWPMSLHPRYAALRGPPLRENWQGVEVLRPRFRHWPGVPRFDPANLSRVVLPLLKGRPIDVIDAEFFWPDGPAAIALGKALGVPVSIKARGSDINYWGQRMRGAVRVAACEADGLLAVSEALRHQMIDLDMRGDRVAVHYTGVDLNAFGPLDRSKAKASLGISGPLLVCAGNLIEAKGQGVLIEALRDLPDVTLALVGEGPQRAVYERLAGATGVGTRVIFTGSLPQAEVARWLAAADVVALASHAEGLANVLVEALASGTPVVTTDVGGAREVINSPEAGRIVERTAEAFATAIGELLAAGYDPLAVRKSAERFTWAANTSALYEHLKALI